MYAFEFVSADTLTAAATLLSGTNEARLLAGGQSLIPAMKARRISSKTVIDISKIAELQGIRVDASSVTIGAGTRHYQVATSIEVAKAIPALAHLAYVIGDPAVRYKGTIGGSLANNDPAADYPAACLALGATIHTSKRQIPAEVFFVGFFKTALERDEIITKVLFPIPEKSAYEKVRDPASRFALCGVFVSKAADDVRVAVTGCGVNGVFRAATIERTLALDFTPEAAGAPIIDPGTLMLDTYSDAEYRAALISVVARRAVAIAR